MFFYFVFFYFIFSLCLFLSLCPSRFFCSLSPDWCLGSSDGDSQVAADSVPVSTVQGVGGTGVGGAPPAEGTRPIHQVPDDVSGSRQSFRMAMTNPCEYFVDVM